MCRCVQTFDWYCIFFHELHLILLGQACGVVLPVQRRLINLNLSIARDWVLCDTQCLWSRRSGGWAESRQPVNSEILVLNHW
jgi:hypothetical protein